MADPGFGRQTSSGEAADPGFGLKIHPATILRSLLQQYPSGGQFFLEALQNADDTGRATKFCALLDYRRHPVHSLRSPAARGSLQSESILFYDDAGFQTRDWRSLQFMCDSVKRASPYEAGHFGMGSRSFFHITDVLQVLSGSMLAALDPDDILETGHFGEQIDFTQQGWLDKFPDEGAPFLGLFGCDMRSPLKGTIIRAALRSRERASSCSFMPHAVDLDRAERIFRDFEETLKNGEVLLFLSCVRTVELWRRDANAAEATLLARCQLGISSGHTVPGSVPSSREVRSYLEQFKTFAELAKDLRRPDIKPPETQDVVELTMEHVDSGAGTKTRRWLRYGAFIRDDETLRLSEACESVPVITLALPLDKQVDGYVFTMLPLPLSTGLPVHVNAHFRLHSNRRAIWHLTSDLEGEHRLWGQWNERLLTDAAPCIYARALQWLATNLGAAADYGQPAWPRDGSVEKAFAVMLDPLVRMLKEMPILVVPDKTLIKPVDALFFPTPTSALDAHRQELLHLCFDRGHKVVDPPEHVVALLHKREALCQKDCKWVLLTVVLPAASSLEKTQLAALLICFLEWAGTWKEDELTSLGKELASVPWVPTEGGVARTIGDCFDPEHAPQAFSIVQQRQTQIQTLLTDSHVNTDVIWRMLRRYGVKAELTWDDAVEEAEAVVRDKNVQRAGQLYSHVDKRHWHLSGDRKAALKRLQAVPWVPATEPSKDASAPTATQLLALPSLFPSSAHKVVWAVAPTFCVETEPSLQELRPGRNIEKEPSVLVEQVRVLIGPLPAVGGIPALPMTTTLEHLHAVFGALGRPRILSEVIMPAISGLTDDKVAILLLAFLDFAASWREAEIQDVRRQLAEVKWIPLEDGTLRAIGDCFDPEQSPEAFRVVQKRRTKLGARIVDATVSAERIFKVLRLCGLKNELTWEDAVEEAESVMQDKDLHRAEQLLVHLDKEHAKLLGNRTSSMLWLKKQPWVPARAPSRDAEGQVATELLALPSLFPKSAHKLIWAVAPSLCTETEPSLHDLRPCRNIQSEPQVLVEQIRVLVASAIPESGSQRRTPQATLQHLRAVFEALPPGRVLSEVALPAVSGLTGKELSTFLLIFLEWSGSWQQDDMNELSRKFADIRWVPVEDGTTRAINDCFDPEQSPQTFSIVRARLARINELIVETGVSPTTVWRVLRLCRLKQEMTWEDTVEEAERIMKDSDLPRADQLYSHISKQHAKMHGGRAGALKKLQSLPWLPASEHSIRADTPKATQLLALSQVFPASEHKLVWAVAPSLCIAVEPSVPELRPGRNIASETSILVEQVRGLVNSVFAAEGDQIVAFVALSKHLRAVFSALAPLRIFSEVVSPVTAGLSETVRAMLILTFLDWLSSLPENDIKDVGRRLANLEWLPVEDGASLSIGECFDPEHSPEGFGIVQKRRAKVGKLIADLSLRADSVHRVLRLCGIKQGITWEDSREEAESIVQEKDVARAGKLFSHLHRQHSQMKGSRSAVLRHLQTIAWVPAKQPALDLGAEPAVQLAKLSEVFPASARNITWAVAPSLHAEVELAVHELRPGRKIEAETGILVKQVRAICESLGSDGQPLFDPKGIREHLRVVFGSLSPARLLAEVVLPAASEMQNEKLQRFILVFLEWTGARKNEEISEVGRKLSKIQWMPVQNGTTHAMTECFDPEHSPFSFTVVKRRRAQLDGLLAASTVDASVIWRVLRLSGLKKEITWEEAVEEAEAIIVDTDINRAGLLFAHICKSHGQLGGNRTAALKKLQTLPWVPATAPSSEGEATDATQLLSLQDVFPATVRRLVWAVAPTLCVEVEPKLVELKACCSVESKPDILAKQVRALVNSALVDGNVKISAYVSKLADLHAVFGSISSERILSEVILPVVSELSGQMRTMLLLTYLAWAATLPEAEVKQMGKKLSTIEWLPVADGSLHAIGESFDPENSTDTFSVVKSKKANVSKLLADLGLKVEAVYNVFRFCGIKQGITWQDAVEEAEAIIKDADVERAGQLFEYLHENHPSMAGNRRAGLDKLQELAWVPASEPTSGAEPSESPKPTKLLALHDMLPPTAHSLVWSVVPCLCTAIELTLHELRPHRSIEDEPDLLIEQVVAIADFVAKTSTKPEGDADGEQGKAPDLEAVVGTASPAETSDSKTALPKPPSVSDSTLKHLRAVLSALTPHLENLPSLDEHPRLKGKAFVPCMPADASSGGATLFTPRRTAFHAKHDHRALHPAFGILNPMDSTIRMLAEGINVSRDLRAEELAGVLRKMSGGEESADLSVTLTIELASRVRAGETKPVRMVVPTASGELKPVGDVYIDDAPWREGESMKLHPRISADDGRLLGCTSVRLEMARQCEAAPPVEEADPYTFGQEADLVSVVKQLLQEYGDDADLVKEFVQNADDAGTNTIAFFLQDETFGTERVVDPRTADLQGAALYICTDMALTSDDIQRMQRVGTSAKRMDANTSGRFGVGMNVMYRFCDCPQLWANSHLHYFDLTQSFVANKGMRRGRKFTTEKLSQNFPDSYAPFTSEDLPGQLRAFPTIFRLALRRKRSELGVERDMASVLEELRGVAQVADKMLMFTRHLNRMEFYHGVELLASHFTDVDDQEAHETFWMGVPEASRSLKPGHLRTHMEQMKITTECPEGEIVTAEWVITHRVGVTDKAMSDLLREQLEKPHGVALVPHGAAAVRVKPFEETVRTGKICCGLPLPAFSNCSAWVHGSFGLLSSRKAMPLPEESEAKPQLDKLWNKKLIQGPVAEAMHGLILHCSGLVHWGTITLEQYFSLFPLRGDRFQTLLAAATFKCALSSAIYPACRADKIFWVSGPAPAFFVPRELSTGVQKALVNDGMKLVEMPDELILEYEEARGMPREHLSSSELVTFLRETFAKLYKDDLKVEMQLEESKMDSLKTKAFIVEMLAFICKGLWKDHLEKCQVNPMMLHRFSMADLNGLPLLLTHDSTVTTFGSDKIKYTTWRELLKEQKDIFIDKDANRALVNAVDTTAEGINKVVQVEIPGIRPFTLKDLLPYKEKVVDSLHPELPFTKSENEPLRLLWNLIAESAGAETSLSILQKGKAERWIDMIMDWEILPVNSKDGLGELGETCLPMDLAGTCVAVTALDTDPSVVESLTKIVQQCGIPTVQHELLGDERVAKIIKPVLVSTNEDLLKLLIDHGEFEDLTGEHRHDLLLYFSVLCIKGLQLQQVARLPLFKTAAVESKFTALTDGLQPCCIDPKDPHANALCLLAQPFLVLLAWPTAQVKPIYEYFGVVLGSGEDLFVDYIIPELPRICIQDEDGSMSEPFLLELHAYVCIENSEKVKRAAADCPFVPTADQSSHGMPRQFISTAKGGAAAAFAEVLSPFLPPWWMQKSEEQVELLHALGMGSTLSPSMILLCAKHLETLVGTSEPQVAGSTQEPAAMAAPDSADSLEDEGKPDNALEDAEGGAQKLLAPKSKRMAAPSLMKPAMKRIPAPKKKSATEAAPSEAKEPAAEDAEKEVAL